MSGISTYGRTGPSGLTRDYRVVVLNQEAPDDTHGLYAKSEGNVTFSTVSHPNDFHTFPMAADSAKAVEVHTVRAWTGAAGDLYHCIR